MEKANGFTGKSQVILTKKKNVSNKLFLYLSPYTIHISLISISFLA